MPRSFAKRLNAVAPSATLEIASRAAQMRLRGVDVFPFGVGEPDFEPPLSVREAGKHAIDTGASKYMPVTGTPPLKDAICAFTARRRGWSPTPSQVCVTVGAKHALFNIALALYEEGDEVVIPTPCWVTYPEQAKMMGAKPVLVPTTEADAFQLAPDVLSRALTPRTKAVVLCTPCNPTGAAVPEAGLRALLEVLRRHDCWIIVDEIYAELVYDGFRHVSAAKLAPDLLDRIVIVDGVSKTYAMTGWRIGWSIAPPPLAKAIDVVQGQSTTTAAAVAQLAALAALTGPQEDVERMRQTFERRRDVMVAGLNAIPGIHCLTPQGAFYAFPNVRGLYGIEHAGQPIADDGQLAKWMLDGARVAAVPGDAFAAPGYMRFSYATSEETIRAGLASLRAAVDQARAPAARP